MQLRRVSFVSFISFISFFGYANAAWQESIHSPPWCGVSDTSISNPCSLPINAGPTPQAKSGDLGIVGPVGLSANRLFATDKIGVGSVVTGSSLTTAEINETAAVLDVNGQIRIRGGNVGFGSKILTSDANGLATWVDSPATVSTLFAGFGIILSSPSANVIAVDVVPSVIQRRITGTCPLNDAISEVKQDGTVTCLPLVSTIGGDVAGGASGAVSLSVQPGAGLAISTTGSRPLMVKSPVSGSGLIVSNIGSTPYLQFATSTCSGSNVYWKYDTSTGWTCGAPLGSRLPGESIMYLRSMGTPPSCPTNWVNLLGGSVTTTEWAGSWSNYVRICGRSVPTDLCQTMYLTHTATPPACPSISPNVWINVGVEAVYAPDARNPNPTYNAVRTCYKCN